MKSIKLYMRLVPYIQSRRQLTLLAYACTMISLALNLAQPFLLSYLIDRVFIAGNSDLLGTLLGLSTGCAAVSAMLTIVRSGLFRYLGIQNTLDIRDVILSHVRRIPLTEIERHGAGKFTALMGMDTATMGNFLNHILVELTTQWFTMLFSIAVIFYMYWRLGVISLISIAILLLIPRLFSKTISRNVAHVRKHNEEVGTYLFESIEGSREIRALGLETWERQRNKAMYNNLVKASTKETLFNVISGQMSSYMISLIIVLLYAYGSKQIHTGTLTLGMLIAAIQYFYNVLNPIQSMNNFFGELQKGEVAMNRIETFLNSPAEPAAMVNLEQAATKEQLTVSEPILGVSKIICRDLHVSYDGISILKGIDFKVNQGQIAAFVGRSGSGKSTLLKATIGFMPIDRADLYLGGRSYKQWSREALSQRVGVVFQESFLFVGTIFENIALGNLKATENEVYEAACKANLKTFIDSLPDGLHTKIEHRGFQLSGGQRQRIAIARVILKKPEILILDEPTSALDRESEEHVLDALKNLMKDKTTLISTHRLDTLISADIIYVMDEGRIVESGTHAELMKNSTKYKVLARGEELQGNLEMSR
ncbi:ABC transporter ATP-binding protein [Paenibacillus sp. GCM10027628]|uniref:ABC transporter ATP-binding protein n=1 Tax=Paenibacillus sp. GCM10027628 TaxID=3273413 RepID=UPI00362FF1CB